MPLQLVVLGGGSHAQSLVLERGGQTERDVDDERATATDDDAPPVLLVPHRPRSAKERDDILRELVRLEKRHWDKGSSWGDQLPTLVAKRNAYVFVLLDQAAGCERGEAGQAGQDGVHQVAYAIVYINALHAQLSKLFTTPARRGRGLATRLVRTVLEAVRRSNKGEGYEVTLMVEVDNLAAQAVYDRCGFRRDGGGVLRDYYAVGRHAWRMKASPNNY